MTRKLISVIVAMLLAMTVLPLGAMAKSATRSGTLPMKDDIEVDGSILLEDFDGDSLNGSWSYYNYDGNTATYGSGDDAIDFSNWMWVPLADYAHSGENSFASFSYYNGTSFVQDNWLFVEVAIPADTANVYLSCYARSIYNSPYEDSMGIYAIVSENLTATLSAWTELVALDTVPNEYTQYTADLTSFGGQTITILFRHVGDDCGTLFLDDVNIGIAGNPPEPTPTPTPLPDLGDLVQGYYFEEGSNAENFTFTDKDGDGYNWGWQETAPESGGYTPYEGEGLIYSASYVNNESGSGGTALTPDNWAISPAVTLPNETAAFSIYAKGQDSSYAAENFALYVGTTADPDQMTKVAGDYTATKNYARYDADLTAYAGQTVYIAIRHYNITDMFYLDVDNVEVWGTGSSEPPVVTHTVVFKDWDGTVIDTQTVNDGEAATAPESPTREGYTFAGWDTDFSNVTTDLEVTATYTINSYSLTIYYVYEGGATAAETYKQAVDYGTQYNVPSPEIEGYTADITMVTGTMGTEPVEVTVTYTANAVEPKLGDVNCDGNVDFSDVTDLFAFLMNTKLLTSEGLGNADVNADGGLTMDDVSALYTMILNS